MVLVEGTIGVGGLIGTLAPSTMALLSLGSLVTMITMVSMCTTCCKKSIKNSDPDDVAYGVIVVPEDVPKAVQFRNGSHKHAGERFSQPVTKSSSSSAVPSRTSAPPAGRRALPELPDSTYSAIKKNRSEKEIEYVDGPTQLYESIDRDNDSMADPLYSKVTENRSTRRYDYPVFMKSTKAKETDDPFYQSASQIYAPGSEDPYSSIASEPRVALAQQEDDSSSAYDPGYAKVKPNAKDKLADREKTEAELDQLYSKIRRNDSRREADSPIPGPSHQVELIEPSGEMNRDELIRSANAQEGDESTAREPSYRYITVRESAEVIRERLRQQGQLGPGGLPIREHYYSTIGNEYETVDGTTYARTRQDQLQQETMAGPRQSLTPPNALSISVNQNGEYAPAPPTSPIPERTPELFDRLQQGTSRDEPTTMYSAITKRPIGPSPTIPTVVKAPSRSRPNSESHETVVVVRPSVMISSNRSSLQSNHQFHQNDPQTPFCDEIQAFMTRPLLPYGTEALVNRRVTEERETVTEERKSRGPMPDPPISKSDSREFSHYRHVSPITANRFSSTSIHSNQGMTTSSHSESGDPRVHNVEIKRVPELHQPILNDQIMSIRAEQERPISLHLEIQKATPGPSSPWESRRGDSKENDAETLSARGRSMLPISRNDSETREQIGKSRQRRQESIEREERERMREIERQQRERLRREKIDEELKRERLGPVYTANDYVSPIGFTSERGWPLVAPDLSPSRDTSRPSSRLSNNPQSNVMMMSAPNVSYIQNSSMLLLDFPSESDEDHGGDGDCEDHACFCHSKSPRDLVSRSNLRQMIEISLEAPLPSVLPPFKLL